MLTLILPETIGNVTALIAGNRRSALCLERSYDSAHTDPVQPPGYGSSWPENHLSTSWRNIMSKERRSQREDKKKPAMTPKEKKAAKKSRKESRDLLGEHGVR